jgi:hypothetical protein
VIDIKDYTGTVSFETGNPEIDAVGGSGCKVADMQDFIKELHDKNIYVIGRVTVFQDPLYTKLHPELAVKRKDNGGVWKDHKGLAFIDVSAKPYWDHVVAIVAASYATGFDEINFDYIRYPSDGDMSNTLYINPNKAVALQEFWKYLHDNVKSLGVTTSADLFGMTTVAADDMGIGQTLEGALPYFDYIAPMVYPSHFAQNFGGFGNPNEHVYQVIDYSMSEAVKRLEATSTRMHFLDANPIASTSPRLYEKPAYPVTKLRPWLQDFDYGGTYGPTEVKAQIKADYDVGLSSWMLWDPANTYTKSALLPS